MNDQQLFVLVGIMEDALVGHWAFRAPDKLAVAGHLLRHWGKYDRVFSDLRINCRHIEQVSPEYLLRAIEDSYTDPHTDSVFYLIRVSAEEVCQVEGRPTAAT